MLKPRLTPIVGQFFAKKLKISFQALILFSSKSNQKTDPFLGWQVTRATATSESEDFFIDIKVPNYHMINLFRWNSG